MDFFQSPGKESCVMTSSDSGNHSQSFDSQSFDSQSSDVGSPTGSWSPSSENSSSNSNLPANDSSNSESFNSEYSSENYTSYSQESSYSSAGSGSDSPGNSGESGSHGTSNSEYSSENYTSYSQESSYSSGSSGVDSLLSEGGTSWNHSSGNSSSFSSDSPVSSSVQELIAHPEEYDTIDGETIVIEAAAGLLANETDPEGGEMTVVVEEGPQHGTAIVESDGSLQYTADEGFIGTDTISYRVLFSNGLFSNIVQAKFNVMALKIYFTAYRLDPVLPAELHKGFYTKDDYKPQDIDVTSQFTSIVAGEKVTLKVLLEKADGTTLTLSESGWGVWHKSWTISGSPIKDHQITIQWNQGEPKKTETAAVVQNLTAKDLSSESIEFYWIKKGQGLQVRFIFVLGILAGPIILPGFRVATFNVLTPEVAGETRTGYIKKTQLVAPGHSGPAIGLVGLVETGEMNDAGIHFIPDFEAINTQNPRHWPQTENTIPPEFTCSVDYHWLQIVISEQITRTYDEKDKKTQGRGLLDRYLVHKRNKPLHLDDIYLRDTGGNSLDRDNDTRIISWDSPKSSINDPDLTDIARRTVFRTYFMVKSTKPNSIAATLFTIDWYCEYSASVDANKNVVFHIRKHSVAPAGTTSNELPEWTGNVFDVNNPNWSNFLK